MARVKVVPNKRGYFEILNDPGIEKELERRGNLQLEEANKLVREKYPELGYEAPVYVGGITKTKKKGTNEFLIVPNENVHVGPKSNPGPPLGKVAQARHSILTKAMDAGRK